MATVPEILVRSVRESDIEAIWEIEQQAFSDPWTERMIRDGCNPNKVNHVCVAEQQGNLLGYCFYWLFPGDEAQILNLAVRTSHRRLGIATLLLRSVLAHAREQKATRVFLEVRVSNETALRFYQHHQFSGIGRRRHYYTDPVEDALMLSLSLSSGSHTMEEDET